MVAGKAGCVTEVLLIAPTEGTPATGGVQPGNAQPIASLKVRHALSDLIDGTDDLMAWHDGERGEGQVAFDDV
jgi:hypothetical protein